MANLEAKLPGLIQKQNALRPKSAAEQQQEELGRRLGLAAALGGKVGTAQNGGIGKLGQIKQARQLFDAQITQAAKEDASEINSALMGAGSIEELQGIQTQDRLGELVNMLGKNASPARPSASEDELVLSRLQSLMQSQPQGYSF